MTGIRRFLAVIALGVIAVLIGALPASATFAKSVKLPSSLSTGSVAAPTDVAASVTCRGQTLYATITWTASPTTRVLRYEVVASVATETITLTAGPNQTRITTEMQRPWAAYQGTVTVKTVTTYGWTKTSAPAGVTTC
jgi:hypothetical protein